MRTTKEQAEKISRVHGGCGKSVIQLARDYLAALRVVEALRGWKKYDHMLTEVWTALAAFDEGEHDAKVP